MIMNIWVRDKHTGDVHQVGTDTHDSLILLDGKVEYRNLQNGDTTGGGYEFVESPDPDKYINTHLLSELLNRKNIRNDLLTKLSAERGETP